jgi:hypothetical protein
MQAATCTRGAVTGAAALALGALTGAPAMAADTHGWGRPVHAWPRSSRYGPPPSLPGGASS